MYVQTIEYAIDSETGEILPASHLHDLSEAKFSALRRLAMAQRLARRKGGRDARFLCALCEKPVYLSRYNREKGNRWFVHDRASPQCPWSELGRLSSDQIRAIQYRGAQEGPEHRTIKEFIARWLSNDDQASEVSQEKTTFGQTAEGQWKRPDVQCLWAGRRIVFEIQLSYVFLSEVIKRDEFYRREGIFIIWVFRELDLHKAATKDEAFFNRRNLFVLDDLAIAKTKETGRLTFSGQYQEPVQGPSSILDVWKSKFITLRDTIFPTEGYRPFFFDYSQARSHLVHAELEKKKASKNRFRELLDAYLVAATEYYDRNYDAQLKGSVIRAADAVLAHPESRKDLKILRDQSFFMTSKVLQVLLSLKNDRPVGYRMKTAYQVLEAGVRQSTPGEHRPRGMAVMYFWAYKLFKPTTNPKQQQWITKQAAEIRRSIDANEKKYYRYEKYDFAVWTLFPGMTEKLISDWAIDPTH